MPAACSVPLSATSKRFPPFVALSRLISLSRIRNTAHTQTWHFRPANATKRRTSVLCQALHEEHGDTPKEQGTPTSPVSEQNPMTVSKDKPVSDEVKKGQRLAILTGAVSIIFGVAYLALVQLLDSRGSVMLPPPPEAFYQDAF